ncbi:MAG: ATP-binding protein [Anaerolineaceae bacterium]|nr:ATP-binding protein [Anaerolineaceae bacterium]
MFVNRISELALLNNLYRSCKAELFTLSGRQRVGKTELLSEFCKDKKSIFFLCNLGSEILLRKSLSSTINQVLFDSDRIHAVFNTWDDVFQALGKTAEGERLVVILDEFPNLVSAHPAIIPTLLNMWNQSLQNSNLLLILSGSEISMMETITHQLQMGIPDNRTKHHFLEPFSFEQARLFFPNYDEQDQVRAYATYGGTPAYLSVIDPHTSLQENILNTILNRGTLLFDDVLFIFQQELREPRHYFAILLAIASGKTRLNEIKQATGLEGAHVYLDTLQQLHLIERIIPVTESQPHKSRRGLYHIKDHYLRFWFRFVLPHRSLIERGFSQLVLEKQITPEIDHFSALGFEDICRQYFWDIGLSGRLSFYPETIGKWWNNQDVIDLVILGDQTAELVECNWSNQPIGTNHLVDLERKAELVKADLTALEIRFAMCSRSGFTRQLVDLAHQRNNINLYSLPMILKP